MNTTNITNHPSCKTSEKCLETTYFNSLTDKEKKAYEVAKKHLGSLWDVYKCNGFLQWQKQTNKTIK